MRNKHSERNLDAIEFLLLGPPCIRLRKQILNIPRKLERAVLYYLGSTNTHMQPYDTISELFWGEFTKERASHNLSNVIYRINTFFKRQVDLSLPLVVRKGDNVMLNPELPFYADTVVFERVWEEVGKGFGAFNGVMEAVNLYRGDFLQGFYLDRVDGFFSEWLFFQREKFCNIYVSLLKRLADYYVEVNYLEKAIYYLSHVLRQDRLQEDIYLKIMKLYYQMGEFNAARRQYMICRDVLKRELGIEPSPQIQEFYEKINSEMIRDRQSIPSENNPGLGGVKFLELTVMHEKRGKKFFNLADFTRAAHEFIRMYQIAKKQKNLVQEARSYYYLGITHLWNHNLKKAEKFLKRAYNQGLEINDAKIAAGASANLSLLYDVRGDFAKSADYSRRSLELSNNSIDILARHEILHNASRRLLWKGQVSNAILGFQEAYRMAEDAGYELGILVSGHFLGIAFGTAGSYSDALNILNKVLVKAEEIGNVFILSRIFNTIGWIYQELGNLEASTRWNEEAINIAQSKGWVESLGYSLVNLASDYYFQGQQELARDLLEEAQKLWEKEKKLMFRWQHSLCLGQAKISIKEGNYKKALKFLEMSLEYAKRSRTPKHFSKTNLAFGEVMLSTGEYTKAYGYLKKSAHLAERSKCPGLIIDSYSLLGKACLTLNRDSEARSCLFVAGREMKKILSSIVESNCKDTFLATRRVKLLQDLMSDLDMAWGLFELSK